MIRAVAAIALLCLGCGSAPDAERTARHDAPATETIVQAADGEGSGMQQQSPDERIGYRIEPLDVKTIATDPRYGTTAEQPVRVGGGAEQGPVRTYAYLNALRGPHGEPLHYRRAGTDRDLVIYELTYDHAPAPIRLYVDWSRAEELRIPVGLMGR